MKKCLLVLCYFLVITFAKAQYVTFTDSINIRETPSISAKVIGQLRHNTILLPDYNADIFSIKDTIGGVVSYWFRIKFNGIYGYVWSPLLTSINIINKTNLHNNFLVHFSDKKKLEFKVFKNDSLLHYSSYERKEQGDIENCVFLGKTFNSQGYEIIGIKYQDENYKYELFEWDGKSIHPSKIKLNDASSITGKYIRYNIGYINNNKVNMRATPDSSGTVVAILGINTPVNILNACNQNLKLNGEWGCWQPIQYNNKEGYVWSTYIDFPIRYIKSNTKEKESFLFTTHAIYAFEGDKISDYFKFRNRDFAYLDSTIYNDFYNYKFTDYGNRGLDAKYSILGIYFPRESGSQQDFYIWDRVKLNYLGSYCAGEDYMCSEYTFPDVTGIKDRIIETRYEENNFINYDNLTYYEQNYLMVYNGHSLVEVPSKYSWLRDEMKIKFPYHRIVDTRFGDLNNDGIEDVMFILQNKSDAQVVGFAFGNTDESFEKFKYNNSIGNKGVVFELECTSPNNIEVKVEYSETDYTIYRYTYDKILDNYIWQSVSNNRITRDYDGCHTETKTKLFKTKKILFENSWQNNLDFNTMPSDTNEE